MKKYLLIPMILLSLAFWGCGGDDDDGDDGGGTGPGTTVPVVTAVTATSAPASPGAATWSTAGSKMISIGSIMPGFKSVGGAAMVVPDSVSVQAAVFADSLYVRVRWYDPDFSVWPSAWIVDSVDGSDPLFEHLTAQGEDQMMMLFAGLPNGAYDTWHWRAMSTSVTGSADGILAGYAEGGTYRNNAVTLDASTAFVVRENHNYEMFNRPTFLHETGVAFTGYILPETSADSLVLLPTSGWTKNYLVPGYLTNTAIDALTPSQRGSRWDIRSAGQYNMTTHYYQVVLRRALNTGFTEDLVMAAGSRLTARVAVGNEYDFTYATGNSNQGFSGVFYIDLP